MVSEAPATEQVSTAPEEVVAESVLETPSTLEPEITPESVAETPAAVAPPVAPPVAPAVPPEIQQYIAKLEEQNQRAQRQSELQVLEQATGQYAQQLAEQVANEYGITAEQALPFTQKLAKERGDLLYQQYSAERMRQGQINAAFAIGKEFGVDPQLLISLPNPQAMMQVAQQAGVTQKQNQEIAQLRKEVAALRKSTVPAQRFSSGAITSDGVGITAENIDALYLKDPERYGNIYRTFLRSGHI